VGAPARLAVERRFYRMRRRLKVLEVSKSVCTLRYIMPEAKGLD
jgi:hypothetical protein